VIGLMFRAQGSGLKGSKVQRFRGSRFKGYEGLNIAL